MDDTPAICHREHEHSEANTYRYGNQKECRKCRRYRWRKYARSHRESNPLLWRVADEPEERTAVVLALTDAA